MIPEIGATELEVNFSKLSFYVIFMLPVSLCVFITINKMATGMVGLCINLPNLCALLLSISQVLKFLKRVPTVFEVNVVYKPKWPIL